MKPNFNNAQKSHLPKTGPKKGPAAQNVSRKNFFIRIKKDKKTTTENKTKHKRVQESLPFHLSFLSLYWNKLV